MIDQNYLFRFISAPVSRSMQPPERPITAESGHNLTGLVTRAPTSRGHEGIGQSEYRHYNKLCPAPEPGIAVPSRRSCKITTV